MFLDSQDVVVVTGAASGMGRAYALAFAQMECQLALTDIDAEGLQETVAKVAEISMQPCINAAIDVADAAAVDDFAQSVKRSLGDARVVINNAGIEGSAQPSWQTPLDAYERVMGVNYFGVVHGCRAFLPQLLTHRLSWLVNVSSVFGLIGTPNHTDYCGSKFAVRGYTEALRAELEGSGVQVMLVHPGGVNTRITRHDYNQSFARHYLKSAPEHVVAKVLHAMKKHKSRVVCGHNSWKTAIAARLLPMGMLSKIIWSELSQHIDTRHYPPRNALGKGALLHSDKESQ